MGDAYTAVADDSHTLFYNPAGLGRHSGVSLNLINPSLEVPDVLDKDIKNLKFGLKDTYENFPDAPEDIAKEILGTPIYLRLGGTPTIKMERFAFTLLANSKTNIVLENQVFPNLSVDYRYDRGFMMGYAHPVWGNSSGKNTTYIGASIKHVNRQGLKGDFDLFGPKLLKIIEDSDSYKDIRNNLGYSKGDGWGCDLGMEHVIK